MKNIYSDRKKKKKKTMVNIFFILNRRPPRVSRDYFEHPVLDEELVREPSESQMIYVSWNYRKSKKFSNKKVEKVLTSGNDASKGECPSLPYFSLSREWKFDRKNGRLRQVSK